MTTDYAKQIEILNDVWINHSDNNYLKEFVEVNDLGLPLAHLMLHGIVQGATLAEEIIQQSFNYLLELFALEDVGFDNLDQIITNM